MIKAVTLWEPYASLMMLGVKANETRSWPPWPPPTSLRGPLLIHAAKHWGPDQDHICGHNPIRSLVKDMPPFEETRGCILGMVHVMSIMPSDRWMSTYHPRAVAEYECGDYRPGRHIWLTDGKPVVFDRPVPYRGAQGLYNVPTYTFAWGNNARRAEMKGQRCIVAARLKKNSVAVAMLDSGNIECVSRNALRKES